MRVWFADGDALHGVTGVTSIGRSVGNFVAWDRGERVLTAPDLLRATAFDRFTVGVRVDQCERVAELVARDSTVELVGDRLDVREVLERRGGDRLAVDGELLEVTE